MRPGLDRFLCRTDEEGGDSQLKHMIDRIDLSSLEDPNWDNGSFEITQMPIKSVRYRLRDMLGVALNGLSGLFYSMYEHDDFTNYSYYGLTALDASGDTRWSYQTKLAHLMSDGEGWAYGIRSGDLLVFDAEGSLRCSRKISTSAGCILGGEGVLYLWTDQGKLYAWRDRPLTESYPYRWWMRTTSMFETVER